MITDIKPYSQTLCFERGGGSIPVRKRRGPEL